MKQNRTAKTHHRQFPTKPDVSTAMERDVEQRFIGEGCPNDGKSLVPKPRPTSAGKKAR